MPCIGTSATTSAKSNASRTSQAPLTRIRPAKASEEGVSLLSYFAIIRGTLMRQFQLAASLNDRNATSNLGRAHRGPARNRQVDRRTSECRGAPITNINNYAFFLNSPGVAD
jgi:hypothetical protein